MLSFAWIALLFVFAITREVSAIGDKAWPIDGRRDESLSSLSKEDRDQALTLLNGFKEVKITAKDGIHLKAIVFDPKPEKRGGKNPLIVFISSWGLNKWEYVIPAHKYAKKGYTVISYTSRGFWGSGGQINLAGTLDIGDISTVIDWALSNTNADENRIGLSGISYGGGLSLLGAANDKRVKSAAAMSCWTDLAQSFLGNGESIRKEAGRELQAAAYLTGEVGEDLEQLFDSYFTNTNLDYMYSFVYNSSAINYLDSLNANGAAIFIANAFSDSLFTPDQFPTKFYNKLTGNKHLEFAPGDHAGPELTGLLGLPNKIWDRAEQWNDYYVRDGKKDVLTSMAPIIINTFNNDQDESYQTWEEITNNWLQFEFDVSEQLRVPTTDKKLRSRDTSLATIIAGENANINGGIAIITATVRSMIQKPLSFKLEDIKRENAAVFKTSPFTESFKFRGTAQVSLNMIAKTSSNGTVVMYLLDVDENKGVGDLITFAPWTFKNTVVGSIVTLPMEITMTAYDIPAKHSLALVIQTHDMLFLDESPEGAEIEFLSGSTISFPVHA